MVPFKRYTVYTIEAIIEEKHDEVPCYDSTIYNLRHWFFGIAKKIVNTIEQTNTLANNYPTTSSLLKIKAIVGHSQGWLKRTIRLMLKSNRWERTRLLC